MIYLKCFLFDLKKILLHIAFDVEKYKPKKRKERKERKKSAKKKA